MTALSDTPSLLQVAEVLEASAKWPWLQSRLPKFIDDGDVLVFASTQARVDELCAQLQDAGIKCASSVHLPCLRAVLEHVMISTHIGNTTPFQAPPAQQSADVWQT